MCGIAGFSGESDQSLLEKMGLSIQHRGPDDMGSYLSHESRTGLAHRRLSIIDLCETGHQPMSDGDGRAVIVYNGELYNYRKLREALKRAGEKFRGNSDTEVLLRLYLHHGVDMLELLNGIFAFAIFDKHENRLFIARDQLGVKPFYYHQKNGRFLFASELKAILCDKKVSREIDTEAVIDYLTYLFAPSPRTMFRDIKKLAAGHAMIVKDGRIEKIYKYYDLPYHKPILDNGFEKSAKLCAQKVEEAVDRQMVADVEVGAFLSGGLDSSAVAFFAARHTDKPLETFTIAFEGKGWEEEGMTADLPYAKKMAKHIGANLNVVTVTAQMANSLEKMIYHLDEPQADPAPLNAMMISKLAKEQGLKVLLSGAGGDDIFTGYRRHFALMQESKWDWLPKSARKIIAKTARFLPVTNPAMRRLSKAFSYADLDADKRITSYLRWALPSTINALCDPIIGDNKICKQDKSLLDLLCNLPKETERLNKMLYLEGKTFLADHNLNYTDKTGMAYGVEIRVPLIDKELVEFAVSVPTTMKQSGRIGKAIFKKAMEPYLPHDVIYRPKSGFGAPLRRWLRVELKEMINDILSERSIKKRGLFDYSAITKLRKDDADGKTDASYTIFSLAVIELYCSIFVDGNR